MNESIKNPTITLWESEVYSTVVAIRYIYVFIIYTARATRNASMLLTCVTLLEDAYRSIEAFTGYGDFLFDSQQ